MKNFSVLSFQLSLVLMLFCGCETAKITQTNVSLAGGRIAKTDTILVKSFDVSKATFKGDYSSVNVLNDSDRQRISRIVSEAMIDGLTKRGYVARSFASDLSVGAVIVEGDVTQVDKGSYNKRLLIGMGSGSQSMTANVRIRRAGNPDTILADLELVGAGGFYGSSGGMWANQDWIGIYSASLGYKVAQFVAGEAKK